MLFRVQKNKDNPYVMMNKSFFVDSNLSAKAKGILGYILTLPDDWKIYLEELAKHFKDGVKSITSGVNELIKRGYIKRTTIRDSKGKFRGYIYDVYEVLPETPKTENGEKEIGKTEIGDRQATNYLNKQIINGQNNESVSPQNDRQTDNIIQMIIKQSELKLYATDKRKLVEAAIRTVFFKPDIACTLKVGLTNEQIRERLKDLRLSHIDRAFVKYNTYKENVKNTLGYFTKVLVESISVAEAEQLEYEPPEESDDVLYF